MSIPTSENLSNALGALEQDFSDLTAAWKTAFLEARRLRLEHRALVAGLFETANSADPEIASACRTIGARLSDACRKTDFEVRERLADDVARLNLDDGTPRETIRAVAEARAKIDRTLAPIYQERARIQALAAAAAKKVADAKLAVATAQEQLADAQRRERQLTVSEAEQALRDAEEQLAKA